MSQNFESVFLWQFDAHIICFLGHCLELIRLKLYYICSLSQKFESVFFRQFDTHIIRLLGHCLELIRFDLGVVVPAPVEGQALVDEEGVVHGVHEELLGGGEALALGSPDVEGDPCLGQQPQQPHPRVLRGKGMLYKYCKYYEINKYCKYHEINKYCS